MSVFIIFFLEMDADFEDSGNFLIECTDLSFNVGVVVSNLAIRMSWAPK